jgi:hypothetical protein
VLAAAAAAIVPIFAGLKSLAMLAAGLAAVVVSLASGYLFLARRGLLRWLSLAVFTLAPAAVVALYAFTGLLWVALASAAGWLIAGTTARLALAGHRADRRMPEHPVDQPAARPFLIMNPKSGGGKVGRFALQRTAEDLGAEVFLLSGPEPVDVAQVARKAVATGADLLGVAGGDGTQALLPGLLQGHRGARLAACAADRKISSPQAVLVSNNSYSSADPAGLGRRVRLDRGVLGVVGVTVGSTGQAVALLRGSRSDGLTVLTATQVTVTADTPQIPVGVDGEALSMPVPVVCAIRPGTLRVRVPRDRPGATPPQPPVSWARLRELAAPRQGGTR